MSSSYYHPFPCQYQPKISLWQAPKEEWEPSLPFSERQSSTTLNIPRGSTDEPFIGGSAEEIFPGGSLTIMKEEDAHKESEKINSKQKLNEKNEEKTQQSISKNNIRNFLTPVVRMREGFFFEDLLQSEKLKREQYENFLKEHFHMKGKSKLNIRQTTFDNLFDQLYEGQLKERKIFALTVIKCIQKQFLKLIVEKAKRLNHHEFKQQFEWINGINYTLIEFLNYLENPTISTTNLS